MSRRRLPPLKSIRAFEAASRHLSFEKAGDELAVTASAVGQQIRSLEAWLGLSLFVRLPSKGVTLTPVGERYAASLSDVLDQLDEATARALKPETPRTLTVATVPSFASGWLIPRLGRLRERCPDLDVRVSVAPGRTDFAREDVDVAIRFGRGTYPGMRTDLLMEETFFAVCSAALLNDPQRPLREPADLRHHTLLHEIVDAVPDYTTWEKWLAAIGVEGIDTSRGPAFPHTFLSLQGAAAGQGVALATTVLIGDYLEAGRLVRPFPHEVKGAYQYYVVCPEATAERPSIAAFRDWVLDEARASGQA
ncbi:transcriptional regulator GcvA [Microvirga antarctica]|uniref:transcriptional regulator GcvA n=1 Tax=Microvirga antarctica TaxID=2819233 RepID=UPI001B3047C6|nr:transcriptional regulator GcvA [Microvirga antarctica]